MEYKTCSLCKERKPKEEFKPRRCWCLSCWRRKHREYARTPYGAAAAHRRNLGWNAKYIRCKHAANQRKIPFYLTKEEYRGLFDKPCFYCGWPGKDTGHGLDRVDSSGPYSVENIVPACAACNMAKNANFTFEEMIQLGRTIREIRALRAA